MTCIVSSAFCNAHAVTCSRGRWVVQGLQGLAVAVQAVRGEAGRRRTPDGRVTSLALAGRLLLSWQGVDC